MSLQKCLLSAVYGLIMAVWLPDFCFAQDNLLALDVGHSKLHSGALSASGKPEFEFNLALAQVVSDTLSLAETPIIRIGFDGDIIELKQRTQIANDANASFFLSIHHDSVQDNYLKQWEVQGTIRAYSDYASGFSLFVSRKNKHLAASLSCASSIGLALIQKGFQPSPHHAEDIAGEGKKWADQANGVYYYDDLVVLKTATMPALLLEAGVIVHRQEEQAIQKSHMRDAIAKAIQMGLLNCGAIKSVPNKDAVINKT